MPKKEPNMSENAHCIAAETLAPLIPARHTVVTANRRGTQTKLYIRSQSSYGLNYLTHRLSGIFTPRSFHNEQVGQRSI